MRAYVLIETKVSMADSVARKIQALRGASARVSSVDTVTGHHDIIAILEANDSESIDRIVSNDIHKIAGVQKTMSCFVLGSGTKSRD